MNRRSFVMSLFGGLAAAGLGSMTLAQAASSQDIAPAMPRSDEIDALAKSALDGTDAEFSQVVVRERIVRRPYRRPVVVRRTVVRRPYRRPIVVRRTVVVRRPRPYYRRPVVVRRRVIVR